MATNKQDISVKRGVSSPKVTSLREALGLSKPEGYGTPTRVEQVQRNIKGGAGADKRKGGASLNIKSAYDTNTKVHFGANDKPRKSSGKKTNKKK